MPHSLNNNGPCRLCGEVTVLVRSHIVPRAFFDLNDKERVTLLSNTPGEYPKRSPIGVYDFILCEACERSLSAFDEYAIKVLKQQLPAHERIEQSGKLGAVLVRDVDYRLLKLFAISLLWRASVAQHVFYRRVKLGPFEEAARAMLLSGDPGAMDQFGVWFSFFDMDWIPSIMDPFKERWAGITAYRFYLGQVLAYVKVDQQPIPAMFRDIALAPDRNLPLVARDFDKSADLRAMGTLVQTAFGKEKLKW